MSDHNLGQTHHDNCWKQHGHSACAVRKIERLQSRIELLQREVDLEKMLHLDLIGELKEDNSRLRAALEATESDDHEWYLQAKEIERLRAALEEVLSDYEAYETCLGKPGRPLHDINILARARAALGESDE